MDSNDLWRYSIYIEVDARPLAKFGVGDFVFNEVGKTVLSCLGQDDPAAIEMTACAPRRSQWLIPACLPVDARTVSQIDILNLLFTDGNGGKCGSAGDG